MDFTNTIKEAQELVLKNKAEWENRYQGYADKILANNEVIKSFRRSFHESPSLSCYISTSTAKQAKNRVLLDVRYLGQSVAKLKIDKKNVTISTKGKELKNKRDFDCEIELKDTPWNDPKAKEFRKYFKNRPKIRKRVNNKGNEEHKIESLLFSEFSKHHSTSKQLLYIQPVNICGIRFSMPTPLSASNHDQLKYSNSYRGAIDILARTEKGKNTKLIVIEVKDENKQNEPPIDTLKQAIQYAVFIRELLRSNCGKAWYEIFGFSGDIPKKLTIRAACAMPDDNQDKSFELVKYPIGDDEIECHYIYFNYDGEKLSDFQSSLK